MSKRLRIDTPILLASASPRRKELIGRAFTNVKICPSSASEAIPQGLSVWETAPYLASLKAREVAKRNPDVAVIGCDTIVILEESILTKPRDPRDAFSMLRSLSGREHSVCTGCCIAYHDTVHCFSEVTKVRFWELDDRQILDYIATEEPMDKAGAYGIQGLGSLFVQRIHGDYFNVVGLPLSRLCHEFSSLVAQGVIR